MVEYKWPDGHFFFLKMNKREVKKSSRVSFKRKIQTKEVFWTPKSKKKNTLSFMFLWILMAYKKIKNQIYSLPVSGKSIKYNRY